MIKEEDLQNKIFLIVGATGLCGGQILKSLIEKRYRVIILVQNKEEEHLLPSDISKKVEHIVIVDVANDKNYLDSLEKCFKANHNDSVNYVISALGSTNINNQTFNKNDALVTERLIEAASRYGNLDKFCLISTANVRHPYSRASVTKNIKKGYKQSHHACTEDYLRTSGLTYLIVRPGELVPGDNAGNYSIHQGDNRHGSVNTATVGRLVIDTIIDPWIPANTSYECFSLDLHKNNEYHYVQGTHKLREESENDRRPVNHKTATKVMMSLFVSLFFTSAYLSYTFGRSYVNTQTFKALIRRLMGKGTGI